ncbi:hypothetical protein AAZX31_18G159000 [Glycine max]
MAESHRTRPSHQQPSRLQSRSPLLFQINRADEPPQPQQQRPPKKVVFKKWQHPAAPFFYEQPSLVPPFVNV